jgi:hypothetical protein
MMQPDQEFLDKGPNDVIGLEPKVFLISAILIGPGNYQELGIRIRNLVDDMSC